MGLQYCHVFVRSVDIVCVSSTAMWLLWYGLCQQYCHVFARSIGIVFVSSIAMRLS